MVELNQLLLEFEANLKWDVVTEEWEERRDGWVSEVAEAIDQQQLAELLVELESNLEDRKSVV